MDKSYNVAIVGCGGISHMHAGWYVNEPRASLTAIADINAEYPDRVEPELLCLIFMKPHLPGLMPS